MRLKEGFTIIEFLVATVILMIALIGTSAFFYTNRRNLVYANLERLSTWSAIEKLEALKSGSYSAVVSSTETVSLSGSSAQRTTTVQTVNEGGITFKQVTVQVNWGTGNLSLVSYIAQQ